MKENKQYNYAGFSEINKNFDLGNCNFSCRGKEYFASRPARLELSTIKSINKTIKDCFITSIMKSSVVVEDLVLINKTILFSTRAIASASDKGNMKSLSLNEYLLHYQYEYKLSEYHARKKQNKP